MNYMRKTNILLELTFILTLCPSQTIFAGGFGGSSISSVVKNLLITETGTLQKTETAGKDDLTGKMDVSHTLTDNALSIIGGSYVYERKDPNTGVDC